MTIHDLLNATVTAPAHALADTARPAVALQTKFSWHFSSYKQVSTYRSSFMITAYYCCLLAETARQLKSSHSAVLCMPSSNHRYLCMSSHNVTHMEQEPPLACTCYAFICLV